MTDDGVVVLTQGGTTFGRHLVLHLTAVTGSWTGDEGPACRCPAKRRRRRRCDCVDGDGRRWLFSRDSTGWACGVHADWTELNACVPTALDQLERQRRPRR